MIKTIIENRIRIAYNTNNIKDRCCECHRIFEKERSNEAMEKRYERQGNYCNTCSAKYARMKFPPAKDKYRQYSHYIKEFKREVEKIGTLKTVGLAMRQSPSKPLFSADI